MEANEKSNNVNSGIPPPRLAFGLTHTEEATDQLYSSVSHSVNPPSNSAISLPPNNNMNNPRRDDSLPNSNGVMYWMRIEDYATQVRIVALQARCGNVQPNEIQKALDLAIKIQEELRPLLLQAQYTNNTNTPMNNNINFANQQFRFSPQNGNGNRQIKIQSPDKSYYQSPIPPKLNFNSGINNSVDGVNPSFNYLPQNFVDSNNAAKPSKRQKRKRQSEEAERTCKTCSTTETPEWRRGPLGPRTLCNACGLKWAKKLRAEKGQSNVELNENESNTPNNESNCGNNPPAINNNNELNNSIPIPVPQIINSENQYGHMLPILPIQGNINSDEKQSADAGSDSEMGINENEANNSKIGNYISKEEFNLGE